MGSRYGQVPATGGRRWAVALGSAATALSLTLLSISSMPALALGPTMDVSQAVGDTQTNVGGGVTVKVTLRDTVDGLIFQVVLDTHSVNLDAYDLTQLAALRLLDGQEIAPTVWDAPAGGHHREGTLTFPAVGADGNSLIGLGPVELVIRGIAGVAERTFLWTI